MDKKKQKNFFREHLKTCILFLKQKYKKKKRVLEIE